MTIEAKTSDRSPHQKRSSFTDKKVEFLATDEVVRELRSLPIFKNTSLIDLVNESNISRGTLNQHWPMSFSTRSSLTEYLEKKRIENMETDKRIGILLGKLKTAV